MFGRPLRCILTAGQRRDAAQAVGLMDELPAAHILADRVYDASAIPDAVEVTGVHSD